MPVTAKQYGIFTGRPYAVAKARLESLGFSVYFVGEINTENEMAANAFNENGEILHAEQGPEGVIWVAGPAPRNPNTPDVYQWTKAPILVTTTVLNGVVIDSAYWIDTADKDLGYSIVSGIVGVASGGWSSAFVAAANAADGDSGDWLNATVSAVKAYYGADDGGASSTATDTAAAAATETGSASMDWDGWNFSSGEAETAFSDATNVDFGLGDWGSDIDWAEPATGLDGYPLDVDQALGDTYVFNAIPEVTTSDFGTSFSNLFGNTKDVIETTVKGIGLAQTVKNITTKPTSGQTASSGSSGAKTSASTAGDVLSSFGKMLSQLSPKTSGAQAQTTQQQTYSGQLTPSGGALPSAAGGISTSTLLIIGGGLIVGALVLHSLKG